MRRVLFATVVGALALGLATGTAMACGGLIGRNGNVNLVRTTTLAAYADGMEHYLTSFEFAGGGGEFGSIIPLPGIPSDVVRGGDWTLQRLVREVTPQPEFARSLANTGAAASIDAAEVLLETTVDALDITVLRGGSEAIGVWAADNGFLLTPDAPEVLEFYASRSPIFLAARFDADAAAARGQAIGDGTPVHITIPTDNPWVPLRILALGRQPVERVEADVFLLTPTRPALLPGPTAPGLELGRSAPASANLLADLRSDTGMEWMPESMWLTYLRVNASPDELTYDLAVDASGAGQPSPEAAGLQSATANIPGSDGSGPLLLIAIVGGAAIMATLTGLALVARGSRRTRGTGSASPVS